MLFLLTSCDGAPDNSDTVKNKQQEQLMQEANSQVGMPAIKYFNEMKMAKMIMELRDQENLTTYTYLYSAMTGKLMFLGKSIGYGLPYSTQFTNPSKPEYHEWSSYNGWNIVLPQADPNGLFMPASADATWVMLVDKDGKPHPTYIEEKVIISPVPLELK